MILRSIDFEFTGEPSEDDPHAVVEVGFCDIEVDERGTVVEVGEPWSAITNPRRPIPPASRAVHHISDEEAAAGIEITTAFMRLMGGDLDAPRPDYFVSHNVEAEKGFFAGGGIPWICTYRAAVRMWPDEDSHKLQNLRYSLNLTLDQQAALPAHRAGPDAYVAAVLMATILTRKGNEVDIPTLARWSKGPPLFTKLTFGKHRGNKYTDVPLDYLFWLRDKSEMGADIKANAKYWIAQRSSNASN